MSVHVINFSAYGKTPLEAIHNAYLKRQSIISELPPEAEYIGQPNIKVSETTSSTSTYSYGMVSVQWLAYGSIQIKYELEQSNS